VPAGRQHAWGWRYAWAHRGRAGRALGGAYRSACSKTERMSLVYSDSTILPHALLEPCAAPLNCWHGWTGRVAVRIAVECLCTACVTELARLQLHAGTLEATGWVAVATAGGH
jgi:hypothetical protein